MLFNSDFFAIACFCFCLVHFIVSFVFNSRLSRKIKVVCERCGHEQEVESSDSCSASEALKNFLSDSFNQSVVKEYFNLLERVRDDSIRKQ